MRRHPEWRHGEHLGDCHFRCESLVGRVPVRKGKDKARWRSGDAEDCKSLYAGSIPARASICLGFIIALTIGFAMIDPEIESAALAQLVEHIIRNDGVTCSSHVSGTRKSPKIVLNPLILEI